LIAGGSADPEQLPRLRRRRHLAICRGRDPHDALDKLGVASGELHEVGRVEHVLLDQVVEQVEVAGVIEQDLRFDLAFAQLLRRARGVVKRSDVDRGGRRRMTANGSSGRD
jgi:hypothetical protein